MTTKRNPAAMARIAALPLMALAAAFAPVLKPAFDISDDQLHARIPAQGALQDLCYNPVADEYFVVYRIAGANSQLHSLYGQRLKAADGNPVGGPVTIEAPTYDPIESPAVAFAPGAGRFMVAFIRNHVTFVRILDAAGADIGAGPVSVDASGAWQLQPDVSCDGTRFLVSWNRGDLQGDIIGRFYDTDGAPEGAEFAIETSDYDSERPCIAYLEGTPGAFLVAWSISADLGAYGHRRVDCATVDAAAVVGAIQTLSATANSADWPRVAANPTDQQWMIAWEETDNTTWDVWAGREGYLYPQGFRALTVGDIAFRRVDAAGVPQGAPAYLQAGPEKDFAPGIAWSSAEDQYVIHWQRDPYNLTTVRTYNAGIRGARVSGATGAILENNAPLASGSRDEVTPVLAARSGSAELLSVWAALDTSISPPPLKFQGLLCVTSLPPEPPASLVQVRLDGVTPLVAGPLGPVTVESGIAVRAMGIDPGGDPVRLEIEVRAAGATFLDTATAPAGPMVPSGSTASVTATGLAAGQSWHWQVRSVNSKGFGSAWVSFGSDPDIVSEVDFRTRTNQAPTLQDAEQVLASTGAAVGPGQIVLESRISFRAVLADADGDRVQLQVEVRPIGRAFSGTPTSATSPSTAGFLSVEEMLDRGSYAWSCQAVDEFGAAMAGGWRSFGGNPDSDADFSVSENGSAGRGGCTGSVAGATGLLMALLACLSVPRLARAA